MSVYTHSLPSSFTVASVEFAIFAVGAAAQKVWGNGLFLVWRVTFEALDVKDTKRKSNEAQAVEERTDAHSAASCRNDPAQGNSDAASAVL